MITPVRPGSPLESCCAVLRCAALRCAVLRCAALCCAALCCAVLCCDLLAYTRIEWKQMWGFELPSLWSRLMHKLGLSITNDINDIFCESEEDCQHYLTSTFDSLELLTTSVDWHADRYQPEPDQTLLPYASHPPQQLSLACA
eukprot:COSAG06_NODE_3001_length_5977_cov_16.775264_5_plen_143_part_00